MILYSEKPIPVMMKNIMMLDDEETGGVVYVSKATYDQATILWSRFEGSAVTLANIMKLNVRELQGKPGRYEALMKICEKMPKPLDILGPFVKLIADNKLNWEEATLVDYYGWMHQISQMIDFNAYTLVPAEVAAKVDIPTIILNSYKDSWEELTQTLEDKVMLRYSTNPGTALSMNGLQAGIPMTPVVPMPMPNITTDEQDDLKNVRVDSVPEETATVAEDEPVAEAPTEVEDEIGGFDFDFTSIIDPNYVDADGNMIGAIPTSSDDSSSSSSSSTDSKEYSAQASKLLNDFADLD